MIQKGFFLGDRFKSVIVEKGDTLINCLEYIDLNPVRAGIIEKPGWSIAFSHPIYAMGAVMGARAENAWRLLYNIKSYMLRQGMENN